jgi:hypothetical protein
MSIQSRIRRRRFAASLLKGLIVLLLLGGALSLAVLVTQLVLHWPRPPRWVNATEGRIRISALLTVAAVVLASANLAALERRRVRFIAVAGIACSMAGLALGMMEAWSWWLWEWSAEARSLHVLVLLWVWAAICAVISLLSFARVPAHLAWIKTGTSFLVALVGVLLSDVGWAAATDRKPALPETFIDMTAIVGACGVAVVVLLHLLFYLKRLEGFEGGPLLVRVACPRCGLEQDAEVGSNRCLECALELRIEIDEACCELCGYPLYKLPGNRCPECGTPFQRRGASQAKRFGGRSGVGDEARL